MDLKKPTFARGLEKLCRERNTIRNYFLTGAILGLLFACLEYIVRLNTNDPQDFIPLIIRAIIAVSLIFGSVIVFEVLLKERFMQRQFLYVVLIRSVFYKLIITFWLLIINIAWYAINLGIFSVEALIDHYFMDEIYIINLSGTFFIVVLAVSLSQINSLHRKGELVNFILGRYHMPKEVERIFCFIDLKSSTTIAEKLGHFRFAMFLKDYYSDITEALRKTNAQIYQYVGDEIVLSWSYKSGLKNNNLIFCFFQMKEIIEELKQKYLDKYGFFPEFKAGIHGGEVIVTWVGELKKEIVYIGDVLNTTARIQEDCKRLKKDFLISEDLLHRIEKTDKINASFVEETTPRGKETQLKLYSLELAV